MMGTVHWPPMGGGEAGVNAGVNQAIILMMLTPCRGGRGVCEGGGGVLKEYGVRHALVHCHQGNRSVKEEVGQVVLII